MFWDKGQFNRNNGNGNTGLNKMRIAAMVCIFFIMANISLSVAVNFYYRYHNQRVQFGYRLPDKFVLIRKELPSVIDYIVKNRSQYDINVIMLGDSVTYGAGSGVRPDENVGKYLEDNLNIAFPGKKTKVWNLSIPGSKPGDTYFLYKKIRELKPNLVVINFNYIFYTPSNIKTALTHNWLVPEVDPKALYREQVRDFMYTGPEERLKMLANSYLPLYRYRDFVNALIFKDQPGKRFQAYVDSAVGRIVKITRGNQPSGSAGTPQQLKGSQGNLWYNQDWTGRLPGMAWMYNLAPVDTEKNVACLFTRAIIKDIDENNVPAVIFMAGQNQKLLQPLIGNREYRQNCSIINSLFTGRSINYIDFDKQITDEYFVDNVHLTAGGNKILADKLAAPVLNELKDSGARGK